jgi:hypothetical protein
MRVQLPTLLTPKEKPDPLQTGSAHLLMERLA